MGWAWLRRAINGLATRLGKGPVAFPPLPRDGRILFHRRDRRDFPFLSNFYPCKVDVDGEVWPHLEGYYQSRKSENPAYREELRKKRHASWAKFVGDSRIGHPRLARKSWFRDHPEDLRSDWDALKLKVMERGLEAKFGQNPDLARALVETGAAVLVEDSKVDTFWGTGADGQGKNHLGKLLMDVRAGLNTQGYGE